MRKGDSESSLRIGADVLFFNPYLRQARLEAGFKTNAELCIALGIGKATYGCYERLKSYPARPEIIEKLEKLLKCPYEFMFPEQLRQAIDLRKGQWKRISIVKEVPIDSLTSTDLLQITDESLTEFQDECDRDQIIEQVLATLTARERAVLERRFGLNGHPQMTIEAIGKEFGVTRERIRQIEAKAVRKLRLPQRSKLLIQA